MKIRPTETNLESFFSGLETKYRVPHYQRDYSWTTEEINQLWADLISAFNAGGEYFVGTLVLNEESTGGAVRAGEFDIVDGQQRLTTLSIIFSVIRNIGRELEANQDFMPQFIRSSQNKALFRKIDNLAEDRLLHRSEPDNFFLTLNTKDNPLFFRYVQKHTRPRLDSDSLRTTRNESRLLKAKKAILGHIRDEFLGEQHPPERLYQFLVFLCKKLQFIRIEVASDYDAYLLFESLNSKGLDLSTADLIKNKLLAICRTDDGRRARVIERWDSIVKLLESSRFSNPVDFLRFYWLAFETGRPTKRDLYKVVRLKLQDPSFDIDRFMDDLSQRAEDFVFLTRADHVWPSSEIPSYSTEQYVAELNTLRYAIHIPALLVAVKDCSKEFVKELSQRSLSFLFRLITLGDIRVGVADRVFVSVVEKLNQQRSKDEIFACFDVEIDKIGDEAFRRNFRSFVSEDHLVCRYILAKIHVHQSGNEQVPKADEVHLEHVLPQDSSRWEVEGFDASPDLIEDLKYSIGNMTLLNKSLNASISNKVFADKVGSYKRRDAATQAGTTFPMTYSIYDDFVTKNEVWTRDKIKKRAEEWASLAVSIWPL